VKVEGQDSEIDVLGVVKNAIILVECVGTETFGGKARKATTDFQRNIQAFDKIVELLKTNYRKYYEQNQAALESNDRVFRKLLVSFRKETRNDVDRENAHSCNNEMITIWTSEEKYYFEKVADCTYDHCQYEILYSLRVQPNEITDGQKESFTPTYLAYGKEVRDGVYILNFVPSVKTLLSRSSIRRLRDSNTSRGYQRLLDKRKLTKMRDYLLKGVPAYPNNIICRLHEDAVVEKIKIANIQLDETQLAETDVVSTMKRDLFVVKLPNTYNTFEIIDGQHRLFSFAQTKSHIFGKFKNSTERQRLKKEDTRIQDLQDKSNLVLTAIYSKSDTNSKEWADPGRLFYQINTTQTKIEPDDVIDLMETLEPNDPIALANGLMRRFNENGVLMNKIRIKFWQDDRIRRPSLIRYSGLKDAFNDKRKTYRIFHNAFQRQNVVKNYVDFCFLLMNNYLSSMWKLVQAKYPKKKDAIESDLFLKDQYYLFSGVFIGALLRLLRHFVTDKDKEFKLLSQINTVFQKDKDQRHTFNINIENDKLQKIFSKGTKILVNRYKFTMKEFERKGWGPNEWARIEADLFYRIRKNRHPKFGDEELIVKKFRKKHR
jgi:DGQHR domain-containing protein